MSDTDDATDAAPSDERLLLRYRDAGDVAAFEELVRRYERPLLTYLAHYLHDESLAQDVYQTTLLHLHQKCPQFTEARRVRPWLYSIATHAAIDVLRHEGRHPMASLDEDRTDGPLDVAIVKLLEAAGPSPLEELEANETAQWTREAVKSLPHPLRVVVLLSYFQSMTLNEIAEALDLPLGTVKSRLHKALEQLSASLQASQAEA